MKKILVCSDRDGTINLDENYYLGSSPEWEKQVKFLPGVVDGIKLLNKIHNLEFFIITNQSGVALNGSQFDELDIKRMEEVNEHIIKKLKEKGAFVKGYFACPFVSPEYAKKALEKGRKVNPLFIKDNCPDLKPNIGMIEKAAKSLEFELKDLIIYTIGDFPLDVETGINAGGTGILVPYKTEHLKENLEKVQELSKKYPGKAYIKENFLQAANFIYGLQGWQI